jgi:hypothetical protein
MAFQRPPAGPREGHGNDSDIEGTHRGKLMQEPSLAAVGVH